MSINYLYVLWLSLTCFHIVIPNLGVPCTDLNPRAAWSGSALFAKALKGVSMRQRVKIQKTLIFQFYFIYHRYL